MPTREEEQLRRRAAIESVEQHPGGGEQSEPVEVFFKVHATPHATFVVSSLLSMLLIAMQRGFTMMDQEVVVQRPQGRHGDPTLDRNLFIVKPWVRLRHLFATSTLPMGSTGPVLSTSNRPSCLPLSQHLGQRLGTTGEVCSRPVGLLGHGLQLCPSTSGTHRSMSTG